MNAEAPNLQSGSISWSEAAVINNDHLQRSGGCGRADHEHLEPIHDRARILLPVNEVVQLNLTTTATETATATSTVTFSVQVKYISIIIYNFSNVL